MGDVDTVHIEAEFLNNHLFRTLFSISANQDNIVHKIGTFPIVNITTDAGTSTYEFRSPYVLYTVYLILSYDESYICIEYIDSALDVCEEPKYGYYPLIKDANMVRFDMHMSIALNINITSAISVARNNTDRTKYLDDIFEKYHLDNPISLVNQNNNEWIKTVNNSTYSDDDISFIRVDDEISAICLRDFYGDLLEQKKIPRLSSWKEYRRKWVVALNKDDYIDFYLVGSKFKGVLDIMTNQIGYLFTLSKESSQSDEYYTVNMEQRRCAPNIFKEKTFMVISPWISMTQIKMK